MRFRLHALQDLSQAIAYQYHILVREIWLQSSSPSCTILGDIGDNFDTDAAGKAPDSGIGDIDLALRTAQSCKQRCGVGANTILCGNCVLGC